MRLRPGPGERLVHDVPRPGVVLDGPKEQLERLLGRVDACLLVLLVDAPDRPFAGRRLELGRVPLDPPVKAWLVTPQVVAPGKHASGLRQHDGLMHEEAALDPRLLDQLLAAGGVPLVDRAVRRQILQAFLYFKNRTKNSTDASGS